MSLTLAMLCPPFPVTVMLPVFGDDAAYISFPVKRSKLAWLSL
jgi:hypothetical protein